MTAYFFCFTKPLQLNSFGLPTNECLIFFILQKLLTIFQIWIDQAPLECDQQLRIGGDQVEEVVQELEVSGFESEKDIEEQPIWEEQPNVGPQDRSLLTNFQTHIAGYIWLQQVCFICFIS